MAEQNSRDLVLAPNQYAFIQDETKGILGVYVGPNRTSLANTDRPTVFDAVTGKFRKCTLEDAILEFPLAVEGSYIVLENPAVGNKVHPPIGSTQQAELHHGRKVNIAGPAMFPLWPGQVAKVIEGHRLRSNQYVIVRVYNEEAARQNWTSSVLRLATPSAPATGQGSGEPAVQGSEAGAQQPASPPPETPSVANVATEQLSIGQLLVIQGNEASFYMPPTGIEVVPDENGSYVREAVTLERLEYCMLLDESGGKRIVIGPKVVFPKPTETFIEKDGDRKFRAIELNDEMGIYVKVIADYEEGDKKYVAGDELFITGREQRIYFPREEHALIKYGAHERHFGVALPEGEARYVLNKTNGRVSTVKGPRILLPDPRREVIMRRVLEEAQVTLWYPGNEEARQYNAKLRDVLRRSQDGSPEHGIQESVAAAAMPAVRRVMAANSPAAGNFDRGSSYTPPRTITLDTKYEGAVAVSPWPNYAVLVVNKAGNQRVVLGPSTTVLEYDETLRVMQLSTGKPKTTDRLERTCYLQVANNQVTDVFDVVTKDMVKVSLKLSYRVNFEGSDPTKWFSVENYVKFLCDHVRSIMRHAAKQVGIERVNDDSIPLIRDAILGTKGPEGKDERPGLLFKENGMRVCDVEVLMVQIGDAAISSMLAQAQGKSMRDALELAELERSVEYARRKGSLQLELEKLQEQQVQESAAVQAERTKHELQLALERAKAELGKMAEEAKIQEARHAAEHADTEAELAESKARKDQELAHAEAAQQQRIAYLQAEVKAVVDKAAAISPDLVAALQAFGDRHIATEAAKAMGPLAILGGNSVAEVLTQLLKGTVLENAVKQVGAGNGTASASREATRL